MWVMGRVSWLLARLCNDLEKKDEWVELSRHRIEFIRKYGFDKDSRMFYSVTRDGHLRKTSACSRRSSP